MVHILVHSVANGAQMPLFSYKVVHNCPYRGSVRQTDKHIGGFNTIPPVGEVVCKNVQQF